jgi:hypothetical protein
MTNSYTRNLKNQQNFDRSKQTKRNWKVGLGSCGTCQSSPFSPSYPTLHYPQQKKKDCKSIYLFTCLFFAEMGRRRNSQRGGKESADNMISESRKVSLKNPPSGWGCKSRSLQISFTVIPAIWSSKLSHSLSRFSLSLTPWHSLSALLSPSLPGTPFLSLSLSLSHTHTHTPHTTRSQVESPQEAKRLRKELSEYYEQWMIFWISSEFYSTWK